MRNKLVGILMGGALLASGPVWAQVACDDLVVGQETVQDWIDAGECIDEDKLYTPISFAATGFPTGTNFTADTAFIPGFDIHTIVFGFISLPGGGVGANQSFTAEYTVEIVNPLRTFVEASIDTTVPASTPDVVVSKSIFNEAGVLLGTLNSTSGNPGGPIPISGDFIRVVETFTTGPNGLLQQASNTFTEAQLVPEPSALFLLALGLAGLGLASRRSV